MQGGSSACLPAASVPIYHGGMRLLAGGLAAHAVTILVLSSALSTACVGRSASSPTAGPTLLDQRLVGGGFMSPRRAPRPRRPFTVKPSLLAATRGLLFPSPAPAATATASSSLASSLTAFLPQLGVGTSGAPPKVARLPARPGCGYVKVGTTQIPLDCATPGHGLVRSAAMPLVEARSLRKSEWHAGAAELPSYVDHRTEGEEGAIRHQGEVGACTAFSLAGAIDHSVAREGGFPGAVSAMHLWARYHTPSMELAVAGNQGKPLTSEQEWPYNASWQKYACAWVPCDHPSAGCSSGLCGYQPEKRTLEAADSHPRYKLLGVTAVHRYGIGQPDPQALLDVLAKGQDLWIAMGFSYSAFDSDRVLPQWEGLKSVIRDFDPDVGSNGVPASHAMTVVGYVAKPGGTYFLLRNSWGSEWGDGGYAWIHQDTLVRNLHYAYVVLAEPTGTPSGTWKPSTPGTCPSGLLPDSVTAQCVPACSDGSARHNGVCADPADCPDGYVNLRGDCVVAAPRTSGVDPSSGIAYQCAPAGCFFRIPAGAYCPLPGGCSTACAAPKYRLAFANPGFLCTE